MYCGAAALEPRWVTKTSYLLKQAEGLNFDNKFVILRKEAQSCRDGTVEQVCTSIE